MTTICDLPSELLVVILEKLCNECVVIINKIMNKHLYAISSWIIKQRDFIPLLYDKDYVYNGNEDTKKHIKKLIIEGHTCSNEVLEIIAPFLFMGQYMNCIAINKIINEKQKHILKKNGYIVIRYPFNDVTLVKRLKFKDDTANKFMTKAEEIQYNNTLNYITIFNL